MFLCSLWTFVVIKPAVLCEETKSDDEGGALDRQVVYGAFTSTNDKDDIRLAPPPFIGYLLKGGLAILFSGKRWFEKIIQKYARLSFRGKSVSSLANLKFALVHAHISKMGST